MSTATENLTSAQQRAMAGRPKVGGFPYLAETLRSAGVTRNLWSLPACQSLYVTDLGPVVVQGAPLVMGVADVPPVAAIGLPDAGLHQQRSREIHRDSPLGEGGRRELRRLLHKLPKYVGR